MDARNTIAQLTGSLPNYEAPKVVKLTKPQTDQAIVVHLDGTTKLDLTAIGNENVTFVHVGDRLIILFDNHSTLTVEPFYDSKGLPLADITVELNADRTVSGAEFASLFPITTDQSILPAAGNGGSPAAGANFETVTVNQIANGQTPLALLTPDAPSGNGPTDANHPPAVNTGVQGPTLGVHGVAGSEDKPIALGITDALSIADPRTSLGTLTITGVPAGVTLSAGVHNADGSFTLTPAQLAGLTLTSDGEVQHFTLTVTGTTLDGPVTGTSTATINVDVTPVADQPTLTLGNGPINFGDGPQNKLAPIPIGGGLFANAFGFEDKPIALAIKAALGEVDADAVLSVKISGIPNGVTLSDNGTPLTVAADGSVTLTGIQQISDLKNNLVTLTSDGETEAQNFNLTVTATTVDGGDTATSASISGTFHVNVTPVADTPTLTVPNEALAISFSTVPGGQSVDAFGINSKGTIVGNVLDSFGQHGFIDQAGSVTKFDIGNISTLANGINDNGDVVGTTQDANGTHGFLRHQDGTFIEFDDTSAGTGSGQGTLAQGINNHGDIVGEFLDSNSVQHGFIRHPDGTIFQILDDSNAGTGSLQGTFATGINDAGVIVGSFIDSNNNEHGFIDNGVTRTTFDVQGAFLTQVNGIDNKGDIAGFFDDAKGEHGFFQDANGNLTVIDAPGAVFGTDVFGVNASGQIVGDFFDNEFNLHAFTATGTPVLLGQVSGNEDQPIVLGINAALGEVDKDAILSVTITGIPDGVTLSDANKDNIVITNGSATLTANQLDGLALTSNGEDPSFDLTVTATTTDGGNAGIAASTSATLHVEVASVADAPTLLVPNEQTGVGIVAGNEDTPITLGIQAALSAIEVDADATLSITIAGLPTSGVSLSNANNDNLTITPDGSIILTPDQLEGLSLTSDGENEHFDLTVTATTTDGASTTPSPATLHVDVTPVADAPTLTFTGAPAVGNEDQPIALGISGAALSQKEIDPDAVLSVTISGVPAGATLSSGTPGTPDANGFTTWSVNAADLPTLTLTSDGETQHFDLTVTAAATDGDAKPTLVSQNLHVDVTPVPEGGAPILTVGSLPPTFTTVNVTGSTATEVAGINNAGHLVGLFKDATTHAFEDVNGTFNQDGTFTQNGPFSTIPLNGSPSANTVAVGINNFDQIVGNIGAKSAFSVTSGGVPVSFSDTNAAGTPQTTLATSVNDSGQIVGILSVPGPQSSVFHGFLDSTGQTTNGQFTTLDAKIPGSTTTPAATEAFGINNAGQIVGFFTDNNNDLIRTHGFLRDASGNFTQIDVKIPGVLVLGTRAFGINNAGEIVGLFTDTAGKTHGFLDNHGTFSQIDAPGATLTEALGINDDNEIVGFFSTTGTDLTNINAAVGNQGFVLQEPHVFGNAGTSILLPPITATVTAPETTDHDAAVTVTISGLPSGAVLFDANHDTISITNGTATLTTDQLKGLSLNSDGGTQHFDLTVTAANVDGGVTSPANTSPPQIIHVDVSGVAPIQLFAADHKTLLGSFTKIQDAVDAARAPGEFIDIKAGTYKEKVVIDPTNGHGADGLTIEGIGAVTVQAPTTLMKTGATPSGSHDIDGIFTVSNANNVTIHNLTVDGLDEGSDTFFTAGQNHPDLVGIALLNSNGGTIDGVTVTGIRESDAGLGNQRDIGIEALNTAPSGNGIPTDAQVAAHVLNTVTVTNSTITEFEKGGIIVSNANAHIDNNTIIGVGEVNTAQNGIQIGGSTGDVSGNKISNIGFITPDTAATGILAFDNNGLTINGNSFTGALDTTTGNVLGSTVGIFVEGDSNDTITSNQSHKTEVGIQAQNDPFATGGPLGLSGTFTVSGNTSDGVPAGGNGLLFDPNPTTSSSVFNITGTSAPDVFAVSPGTDNFTGGTGNDTFLVESAAFLSPTDTLIGGGVHNNIAFASATPGDTLVVGTNVTNLQEIDFVDPATPDSVAKNVDASALTTGLTIVGNNADDIIAGSAGSDIITGGGGVDTVVYQEKLTATNFTFDATNNNWTVTTGTEGTDTLHGITKVADGTSVATVAGGTVGHEFLLVGGGSQFTTIQEAVNAAQAGDTILIAPGTYIEQVSVVGKNDLTIEGIGPAGSVILDAPGTLVSTGNSPSSGRDIDGLITVTNATGVTIEGVTVNGLQEGGNVVGATNPTLVGVAFLNASGTVDHVDVKEIQDSVNVGDQRGVGIEAVSGVAGNSITVQKSSVEDFQKGGIVTSGVAVDINNDTITGAATSAIAQNGIQVSNGSGDISNNTISQIGFIPTTNVSTGVLFFDDKNLTIDGNIINGALNNGSPVSDVGIDGLNSSNITITNNQISNVLEGIQGEEAANFSNGVFAPPWSIGNTNVIVNATQQGLDFEVAATDTQSFNIVGTTGGNDLLIGGAGNDTFTYNVDFVHNGTQTSTGGGGTNTEVVNGTTTATTFNINAINNGGATELGIHVENGTAPSNAVLATLANSQVTTSEIQEIVLNLGNAGDKVVVNGDLSGTGVATHTITINGGTGNDTVDLSQQKSDEDVVFTGGGGIETVDLGFTLAASTLAPIFDANNNLTGVNISHKAADGTTVTDTFTNVQNFVFSDQTLSFAPTLQVTNASGPEDHAIPLSISAALPTALTFGDPNVAISFTISNIPAGVTLSDTAGQLAINDGSTGPLTMAQLAGLMLTANGDVPQIDLTVTAATTHVGDIQASTSAPLQVDIADDKPTLSVTSPVSGTQDQPISLTITPGLTTSDPNLIETVTISNIPTGVTLSDNVGQLAITNNSTGPLTLAQLAGLKLTGNGDTPQIDLTVTAATHHAGDPTIQASTSTTLHVNVAVDQPTLNVLTFDFSHTPVVTGPSLGFVNENEFVGLARPDAHPLGGFFSTTNGSNSAGVTVGEFEAPQPSPAPGIDGGSLLEGFERNAAGVVTNTFAESVTFFNGVGNQSEQEPTAAQGINASGQVVGTFVVEGVTRGFEFNPATGAMTTIDDPDAGIGPAQGTAALGINDSGQIVGTFIDGAGVLHGFVDTNGQFTTLNDPQAGTGSGQEGTSFQEVDGNFFFLDNQLSPVFGQISTGQGTAAFAINNAGQVTGGFEDSNGVVHGADGSGFEDKPIELTINAGLTTPDANLIATVTISNIPAGVTLSDKGTALAFTAHVADDQPATFAVTAVNSNSVFTSTGIGFDSTTFLINGFENTTFLNGFVDTNNDDATPVGGRESRTNDSNAAGQTVGEFVFKNANNAITTEGFELNDGVLTTFAPSGAIFTAAQGINASGQVVGEFVTINADSNHVTHGFEFNPVTNTTTTIDDPDAGTGSGQGTQAFGINASGQIVGTFIDSAGVLHGFVDTTNGHFTTIDVPDAGTGSGQGTAALGINDAGQVTGVFKDANGVVHGFEEGTDGSSSITLTAAQTADLHNNLITLTGNGDAQHFDLTVTAATSPIGDPTDILATTAPQTRPVDIVLDQPTVGVVTFDFNPAPPPPFISNSGSTKFGFGFESTTFLKGIVDTNNDDANPIGGQESRINDAGSGNVGEFFNARDGIPEAFITTDSGTSTFALADTLTSADVTVAQSVNDPGQIVGEFVNSAGIVRAFEKSESGLGSITVFDDPNAGKSVGQGTEAFAINDNSAIVGTFIDSNGVLHGFVDNGGRFTTIDAPGAGTGTGQGTAVLHIDNAGDITGVFEDANNVVHGFTAEPGTGIVDAPISLLVTTGLTTPDANLVETVTISGIPTGVILSDNAGLLTVTNGSTGPLTLAQLAGLTLTGNGDAQLTVTAAIAPVDDPTDIQATTSTTLQLDIVLNQPTLSVPQLFTISNSNASAVNSNSGFAKNSLGFETTPFLKGFVDTNNDDASPFGPAGSIPIESRTNGSNSAGATAGEFIALNDGLLTLTHGFERSAGNFIDLVPSPGNDIFAAAQGINASGQVVGEFIDNNKVVHGFEFNTANNITITIDDPNAGTGAGQGTEAFGINDSGQIVGAFSDSNGAFHGFVDVNGQFTTIDVPNAVNTAVLGINDADKINGVFQNADGTVHDFTAQFVSGSEGTPIPLGISAGLTTPNVNVAETVTISGLPAGVTLSDTLGHDLTVFGGSITLTPAELAGLTLTDHGPTQQFFLTVTASAQEESIVAASPAESFLVDVTGNAGQELTLTPTNLIGVSGIGNQDNVILVPQGSLLTSQLEINGSIDGVGHNFLDFTSTTSGDKLVVGANVTNIAEVDLVDPTTLFPDNVAKNVDASAFSGDLTIVGNLAANVLTASNGTDVLDGGGGADTLIGGTGADTFVFDQNALNSAKQATPALAEITNFSNTKGDAIDLSALLDAAFGVNPTQAPVSNLVNSLVKVTENADGHSATLSVDVGGTATPNQFVAIAHLDGVQSGAIVTAILDHAHHTAQLHVA